MQCEISTIYMEHIDTHVCGFKYHKMYPMTSNQFRSDVNSHQCRCQFGKLLRQHVRRNYSARTKWRWYVFASAGTQVNLHSWNASAHLFFSSPIFHWLECNCNCWYIFRCLLKFIARLKMANARTYTCEIGAFEKSSTAFYRFPCFLSLSPRTPCRPWFMACD